MIEAMETIYVCILTLLGVFAMMLWLEFRSQRVRAEHEERLRSIKQALDGVDSRVTRLEEEGRKADPADGPETSGDRITQPKDGMLTMDGIIEAVREAGYVPEKRGDAIVSFVKDDELYYIDAERMPRLFIRKGYRVDPKEWDVDLMKQAAHQMSDEVIMVKADVDADPDEEGNQHLSFFLAAMDRTIRGFRENLKDYIEIIDHGQQRMSEMYGKLEDDRKEAASLNGLATSSYKQNGQTPS